MSCHYQWLLVAISGYQCILVLWLSVVTSSGQRAVDREFRTPLDPKFLDFNFLYGFLAFSLCPKCSRTSCNGFCTNKCPIPLADVRFPPFPDFSVLGRTRIRNTFCKNRSHMASFAKVLHPNWSYIDSLFMRFSPNWIKILWIYSTESTFFHLSWENLFFI